MTEQRGIKESVTDSLSFLYHGFILVVQLILNLSGHNALQNITNPGGLLIG